MKLINKLLPIAMVGAATMPLAGIATSCSQATLSSIELEFDENFRNYYTVGETVNTGGIKVYGIYSNGKRSEIEISKCKVSPSETLTTEDNTVRVEYEGKSTTYQIYVFESVIEKDTSKIERFEPAEPEKVYSTKEASDLYFKTSNGESQIKEDVVGYISDYAKVADAALQLERETSELAPVVSKVITFLINLILGENANFIGQFHDSEITVTSLNVDSYDGKSAARLSANLTVSIDTEIVDRSGETPIFKEYSDTNKFKGAANITVTNMPYFLGCWREIGQYRPYFGIGVQTKDLKTDANWSVGYSFVGSKVINGNTTIYSSRPTAWSKDHYFPEEKEQQLIEFMSFQSYYLDKLKAQ